MINIADFQWCNVNKTACFLMPEQANPCPAEDRGISDKNWRNKTKGEPLDYLEDLYWGCTYNATKDKKSQNLVFCFAIHFSPFLASTTAGVSPCRILRCSLRCSTLRALNGVLPAAL